MEFRHLSDAPLQASCDLLAIPVFGDPGRDPLFKAANDALEGELVEAARTESFEGKPNQTMVLWTHGRLKARRIVVLGLGAKGEVSASNLRDCAAAAAQTANRVGAE